MFELKELEIIRTALIEAYRNCTRRLGLYNRNLFEEPGQEELKERYQREKIDYAELKKKVDEIIDSL